MTGAPPPAIEIAAITRAEIAVEPWQWPFSKTRRADIDRHFAARRLQTPALWNGRVILMHRYAIEHGVLRGASFETDYASFLAWRDWGFADAGVLNVFATTALRSADGAYLLGEMAPSTSIAGQWLFPSGTPDPADVGADGMLDLDGSAGRELREETGLDISSFTVEDGWTLVRDRGYLALIKRITAPEDAQTLRARVARHLGRQAHPEFCAIHMVRGVADFDPAMPRFLRAYLARAWT